MSGSSEGRRLVLLSGTAIIVGVLGGGTAGLLLSLIRGITHLAFFRQFGVGPVEPWLAQPPWEILVVPVVGALLVGVMARWGADAIRGHGIPEVMDRILHAESRISAKLMILKPVSAAIAIGTGGPFGAEGPIIATGGALGSVLGQLMHVTADERKMLLAAGAAAGMAATFGSPVAAVLLAVELLLFEYRARSIIPVAFAACAAVAVRMVLLGTAPVFPMPDVVEPSGLALAWYALFGAGIGVVGVGITKSVYFVEDIFERLPVHWMWWPAIGAVAVGTMGVLQPRILGVGYTNISDALSGNLPLAALASILVFKFVAWAIYLGSGTSGGTLAPLFTFGSALGAIAGALMAAVVPEVGVAPSVAALVGMAAMFAGTSRALLASVVLAFETTRQPVGLLPLLAGCSAAYLFSRLLMRHSIMTEKLARRGVLVQEDYAVDYLARRSVRDFMSSPVEVLRAEMTLEEARATIEHRSRKGHQGFPVLDERGDLVGVVTRRDLFVAASGPIQGVIRQPPMVVGPEQSLRDAADIMVRGGVGRLPVVSPDHPTTVIGILTRSDLLRAHAPRLEEAETRGRSLSLAAVGRSFFH